MVTIIVRKVPRRIIRALAALARLGYYNYTYIDKQFEMLPPGNDPRRLSGLAGNRVR